MDANQPSWTVAGKVAFRFFVVYFVLYAFPFPLTYIPGLNNLWSYYGNFWHAVVPWVGQHVLAMSYDVPIPGGQNGSGDTSFRYVQIFTIAIVSLVACIAWSIIDRRRRDYNQMSYWTLIGMRYYLATWMIWYGFHKVFMMQFHLSDARMLQTYGDSSPMGLLWTFMGYSYGYNLFTGIGEVLGGTLLFFRRTVTTGSLLLIAVLSNVVVLNFTYDVPVKIFSSHLLMIAIVLAMADGKRIFNFLLNKPADPRQEKIYLTEGWFGKTRFAVNLLFIAWILVTNIAWRVEYMKDRIARTPILHGNYLVKEFYLNGTDDAKPGDTITWKSLRIEYSGFARAILLNDHAVDFTLKVDSAQKTFCLRTPYDRYLLNYALAKNGDLDLWGPRLERDSVRIKLERIEKKRQEFILLSNEFHWINEYPDNR